MAGTDGQTHDGADVNMDGEGAKAEVEVEGEPDRRLGWIVGDELNRARSEEGWEVKYEQKWPFRATSASEDWEGRAYVMFVFYCLQLQWKLITERMSSLC